MQLSTQTLLTTLIVLISLILMIVLAAVITLTISLSRLLKKFHALADSSGKSVGLLKEQLTQKIGIIGIIRYVLRKIS